MKRIISIIFLFIFALTILAMCIVTPYNNNQSWSSLYGYRIQDKYFAMTSENIYIEVPKHQWYVDYAIWLTLFILLCLSFLGIIFFVLAYVFPIIIKFNNYFKNNMW